MSPAQRPRYRYDVFISYSHRDKAWVRDWLVPRLKRSGLRVCIDHESFEGGAPSLTEMERAVRQSRKIIPVLTPAYVQSAWAEFENILVQSDDPTNRQRRLLPVLLECCTRPPRLGILTYIDFSQPHEHDASLTRLLQAVGRRVTPGRASRSTPATGLPFDVPTGALAPDSPLYIKRHSDAVVRQQVERDGSTTFIAGARQMGKSSLLAQALAHARSRHSVVLDFDLQTLDERMFDTLDTLLRYFADAIHERLQPALAVDTTWQGPLGTKEKLTSFVHQAVLQPARHPVLLVIDEADRVFGRPYQDDFFALLRAWHNLRSRDQLWRRRFTLILACSSDPRQAIPDPQQSPFNVGQEIKLDDFTPEQVWELNRRYGRPLTRRAQRHALMAVIGGHPYLVQQALYALAAGTHALADLLDTTQAGTGLFARHLQHLQRRVIAEPGLQEALLQILQQGRCVDSDAFSTLCALGAVRGPHYQAAVPRCGLYADYFREVWS